MTAVRRMHVLQQQAGTMLRNMGYEPLITTNIGIFRYITFNLIACRDLKNGSFDVVMVKLRISLHAVRSVDEAAILCREEIRCVKKFFDLVPDNGITGRFEVWFSIPWNKFQTFEITRTGIREILSPDEKTGNICGAVTGALMVIGLKYGKATPENCAERERTYELVREFVREYTALHGSVNCTDLLGYDLSDPAAHAEAQEKRVAGQKCPKLVEDAVFILEKIIKAHP